MNPYLPIFGAIGLALVGVGADALIKKAAVGSTGEMNVWFWLGMMLYASTAFGWFSVMKTMKLGAIGFVYSLSTVLFLLLAGFFFFGEQLSHREWLGVLFGFVALCLLGYSA